ncbi:MAG: pantoate--beta-alanine ligase [candidate division WOR-3 bacterium]|nr:pantoate--beta-alanine ligase [candidate division WOR-3 bacterium]MCX7947130.1 pantoate--beta-alanine ligase [candidate division WOR-3 bacterium]MDW8149829.1 pantoate--beta-alanine ligase [candidate division WOR-3 bacterium]
MKVIRKIGEMMDISEIYRREGRTIGFVPTMGYLHQGHTSLFKIARKKSHILVVSIFVNPLQFGPNEDYKEYPRDLQRDLEICKNENVDIVFAPSESEMYLKDFSTFVEVKNLDEELCGKYRPGHFIGVATVVLKLFNIVKPHIAVFGLKDAQQYFIIRRMVRDLNLDIEIIPGPTIRESDGLAMSSRNVYLNSEERKQATVLYKSLMLAKDIIEKGERSASRIIYEMEKFIKENAPLSKIQYIQIVDTNNLKPIEELKSEFLIALAVFFGKTRLIDNIIISLDGTTNII